MFTNCSSLLSLDLSNLETQKVNNMSKMFQNCNSIIIIDLSSFDTSLVTDMSYMFSNCSSLEYLDMKNLVENDNLTDLYMFDSTPQNLLFCSINLKNENSSIYSKFLSPKLCEIHICSHLWKEEQQKYIPAKNICIDKCKNDDKYKYEFKGICYEQCPNNTRIQLEDEFLCDLICPEENPYEIVLIYDCVPNCSAFNFFNKICKINHRIPKIKDDMTCNIDNDVKADAEMEGMIYKTVEKNNEDLLIKSGDMYYQITSSQNQNNNTYDNFSSIDLGDSEGKLKKIFNIDPNDTLIIFKTDIIKEGYNIPIIEYNIYHMESKKRLDLSQSSAQDLKVNISIPVIINESKLFKYDPFNEYYNDVCHPFTTENGTDIILNDRIKEFELYNYSLCEKDCAYIGYDTVLKRAKCECKLKSKLKVFSEIIVDTDLLYNNFKTFNKIANIDIIKCYKSVFNLDNLIKNVGSYTILGIAFLFLVTFVLFFANGYGKIIYKINQMASVKFYEREKEMQKEKERIKQIEILKNEQTSYNSRKNSGSIDKDKLKDSFSSKSIDDLNFKKEKNILKPSNDVDHGKKLDRQAEKILKTVDLEINRFPYEKALQFDDRTYLEYYCSLLRTKHLLIFSFYPIEDYNLMPIKIYLFFFSFGLYFTINALFFTNSTMHRIYEDQGSFNFVFQIPQIFYSTIISAIFTVIIKYLALTDQEILNIKQENKKRKISQAFVNAIRCTLIKFLIFSLCNLVLLFIFWYYLSCFCSVYKNTQAHLIKDTLISFGLALIYPLIINLIPGLLRIPSLKRKNREWMYNISKVLQIL